MKKFLWILTIIFLGVIGYYAFKVGLIALKSFIGLFLVSIFVLGFYLGTISTKRK